MAYPKKRYSKYRGNRYMRRKKRPIGSVKCASAQYPVPVSSGVSMGGLFKGAGSWINTAYRGYSTASKALKLGSFALSMLNSEKKYFDVSHTTVNPSTPATTPSVIPLLSSITVGDGATNRDGIQIRLKSLVINSISTLNASATATRLRIAVILDRRPQIGGSPSWTDFYDSSNVTTAMYNLADQWKRFRIITDKTVVLQSEANEVVTNLFVPMSLPIRYDSSGQPINNELYLVVASDETTNTPTFGYRYRVRFYDN